MPVRLLDALRSSLLFPSFIAAQSFGVCDCVAWQRWRGGLLSRFVCRKRVQFPGAATQVFPACLWRCNSGSTSSNCCDFRRPRPRWVWGVSRNWCHSEPNTSRGRSTHGEPAFRRHDMLWLTSCIPTGCVLYTTVLHCTVSWRQGGGPAHHPRKGEGEGGQDCC